MRIFVRLNPSSREAKVEVRGANQLSVFVKEKPKDNEANFAAFRLLADHYHVPIASVRLLSGRTSRQKVFEIKEL